MENVPTSSTPPVTESVAEAVPAFEPQKPPRPSLPTLPIKKIVMVVGVLIVLLLVGVGAMFALRMVQQRQTAQTDSNRQISLTYWGLWETNDALTSVIKEFENQNPGVTIQYSPQSAKDYNERLQSACARSQCPDIFRFHSTWTASYTQKELLAPIPAKVLSASAFNERYYPFMSTDLKTAQGYMGMPVMLDGLGLYVNKRMLTSSGKSVPVTWDELRTLARELTVRNQDGALERAGISLGSAENVDHFSDILAILILQNGGNPGKPTEGTLVSDALTFYTQFFKEDKVWDETLPNSTYAFAIEKSAMLIAPSWRSYEIRQINPNFEFEIYPIPQLPGDPVNWATYWVEGVSKQSKEQETAWKFLEYLSRTETLEKLHTGMNAQRLPAEIYPRKDMADKLINDKYMGAYVRQASTAKSWYLASRTFDKGINDELIASYKEAITSVNKGYGSRLDDVIKALDASVSTVLQKYGIRP